MKIDADNGQNGNKQNRKRTETIEKNVKKKENKNDGTNVHSAR